MERPPLPNLLVTLDTICIVDVTGINDPELLRQALLATLWEHDYHRGECWEIVFYSDPVPGPSTVHLSSEDLFTFCQNCAGSNSLKLFPDHGSREEVDMMSSIYSKSPPWYQAPEVVVSIFSKYEKKFICSLHLAGAQRIGMILDKIAKELQYHHYYLPGVTWTTSEHQPECGPHDGPAEEFYGHFREDIGPDGSLKLFVNAYQARAAKRIVKQQPGSNDLNIAGQVLSRIVATIVARQSPVCTVVLTGIDDPPIIRQRIIEALRFYEYFIQPDVVITQTDCSVEMTYSSLTDNVLFSLCREQGDKHGSLKLFVEASTLVYADEYERPRRNPLPKIIVSVLDWDNQEEYFNIDMRGLRPYEVHEGLRKEVKAQINMKLVKIYGPEPHTWFSWENLNYHLFDLIREKGALTRSLKLFVTLQEDLPQDDSPVSSPESSLYACSTKAHKLSYLGRVISWFR